MELTRLEKQIFSALFLSLIMAFMLLIVKISSIDSQNNKIITNINNIAKYTNKTPLEKTFFFDEKESQNKLNLNRTNLSSIKEIPCLNGPLAKRIFEYISEKGQINDLSDLLEVKGMTRKKIKQLDYYATVRGGHAGSAAWGDKIDLNFAKDSDLAAIPGISKKMAEKIINYRNSKGSFQSVDDLYAIPGLSEKNIKSFIDKVEVK